MDDVEPAVIVWLCLAGAALAADVVLVRRGYRSLSQVAGAPGGRMVRRALDLHFDSALPFDPFTFAARLIRRNVS